MSDKEFCSIHPATEMESVPGCVGIVYCGDCLIEQAQIDHAKVEPNPLLTALRRIASDHIGNPHVWAEECDACNRQKIAKEALDQT